jgi:hypothetical protein
LGTAAKASETLQESIGIPYCKKNTSFRCEDCTNKLWKDFSMTLTWLKKMPCGRTKSGYCENVLAPRSVQDLINVLKERAKSRNFLYNGIDASNHKNKDIPTGYEVFGPSL